MYQVHDNASARRIIVSHDTVHIGASHSAFLGVTFVVTIPWGLPLRSILRIQMTLWSHHHANKLPFCLLLTYETYQLGSKTLVKVSRQGFTCGCRINNSSPYTNLDNHYSLIASTTHRMATKLTYVCPSCGTTPQCECKRYGRGKACQPEKEITS